MIEQNLLRFVGLHQLRAHLSEAVNRAAFGNQPTVIMRRRDKVAAIVSFEDLLFLDRMKRRRAEALREPPPHDQTKIGAWLARQLEEEIRYS